MLSLNWSHHRLHSFSLVVMIYFNAQIGAKTREDLGNHAAQGRGGT